MRDLLSDIAIHRGLASLPGWSRKGDTITKTYQFKTFPAAISFVDRVAEAAETADHHPDIDIRYTKVMCTLSTHDARQHGSRRDQADDNARSIEDMSRSVSRST